MGHLLRGSVQRRSTLTVARRQLADLVQAPSADRSAAGSSEENTTLERDAT
jgi:hypothetical protein